VSYDAIVYRACGFETPLWSFANTSRGRWNNPNTVAVQYLSTHPMTPWAEMLRNLSLRTADQARTMRLPIWAIRVSLQEVPLELEFARAGDHGLEAADLVADDRTACQALGGTLARGGSSSILVPSAALPGTRNLVIFDPAVVIDYHRVPLASEDFPTAMASQDGRCPEDLWQLVHHQGSATRHAELEAFLAGEDYELEQPLVTVAGLAIA
jgi:RES domain-containing protein